jgi:hypothetical protein
MRLVSLILLIAIVVLLIEHHFKKVEDAYHRGIQSSGIFLDTFALF